MTRFEDRFDAGRFLARQLQHHAGNPNVVVLALPRGGVPVAFEIARAIDAPLDVFVVRKLGAPGYEELAMGAIATGGVRVFNEEVIQHLGVSQSWINATIREQEEELERREKAYRGDRPPAELQNRTVILVDDGLATGASMRAAVRALRLRNPSGIAVAVPIGSRDTCDQFRSEVEDVVCGRTPEPFHAVGAWYRDFTQTTDDEVRDLLDRAAHERRVRRVREHNHTAEIAGIP
jgi:predicted phosphoribosyltransferase